MFSELAVKISADIKDFEKGFKSLEGSLDKISKGIGDTGKSMTKFVTGPILAVGGGLLALATKTGDFADRILDLSEITGMSTDAIQEFQNVARIAGVETEAVTTASGKLTKQMSELETGTGKGAEALADLGIEFGDLEKMSPDDRMKTLINALAEIEDPAERARVGTDLLKGSWQDIAPIVALGADGIAEARQAAIDMGAVMGNQALNDANDFRIGMQNLKTEFMAAGQGIAAEFLPILTEDLMPFIKDTVIPKLREFAEMIKNLFARFKELSPETQATIGKIILLVAAIGPALLIMAKLIAIVKGVIIVVRGLSAALLFLNANPIGLIILGIAAIIAIGILLYENWDTVKAFAIKTWEFIKGLLDTNIGKIVAILSGPIGIGLLIIANWELIKEKTSEIFNIIKETLMTIFTTIKDFIFDTIDKIIAIIDEAGKLITETWEKLKTKTLEIFNAIKETLMTIFTTIKDFIFDRINDIVTNIQEAGKLITDTWEKLKTKTTEIFNKIKETLETIFTTIRDFIIGRINNIVTNISNDVQKIKDSFTSAKDFIMNIFSGIETGITNAINRIRKTIDDVLGFFKRTKETIDNFTSGAKDTISNVGGFIKGKIPFMAEGGIVTAPTLAMIGEDRNPEMVIPLNKFASLSNNKQTNIYLDGKQISNVVAPHMVDTLRTKLAY